MCIVYFVVLLNNKRRAYRQYNLISKHNNMYLLRIRTCLQITTTWLSDANVKHFVVEQYYDLKTHCCEFTEMFEGIINVWLWFA